MAYSRSNRRNYRSGNRRKKKYTKAEQIAFEIGQRRRVSESLNRQGTRVNIAYNKGYNGVRNNKNVPLY